MLAAKITAPDAKVRFPTLLQSQIQIQRVKVVFKADPVFSDIHAMFSGCVYGQQATNNAAKYLYEGTMKRLVLGDGCDYTHFTPLLVSSGRARSRIHPTSCHVAERFLSTLPIDIKVTNLYLQKPHETHARESYPNAK